MKTKIISVFYCDNKKCSFNIGNSCITRPEIDNHDNCLSCDRKFKIKKDMR